MSPAPKQPFRSPDGRRDPFSTELRYEFLRAVDRLYPDLASEMVRKLGPVFKSLAQEHEDGDLKSLAWNAGNYPEFLSAWEDWARPRHLHYDRWILERVLALLPGLLEDPEPETGPIVPKFAAIPLLSAYPVPGRQISPPDPYDPAAESRPEYEARVRSYADLVEQVSRAIGWTPAPATQYEKVHLSWLARFQVGCETVNSIAASAHVDLRNVEKAIKHTAGLIGLTRRTVAPR